MGRVLQPNQVADAFVTAPGNLIQLTDGQPATSIDLGSGDTRVMPEADTTVDFVVPVAGLYKISAFVPFYAPSGLGSVTIQAKVVFDEGEAYAQTVGYGDEWQARSIETHYAYPTFYGEVELTAGPHTAKMYAKEVAGTNGQIPGSGTIAAGAPKVVLTGITGSGAGGGITATDTAAGPTSLPADGSFNDLASTVVSVSGPNDVVLLTGIAKMRPASTTTATIQVELWAYDGTTQIELINVYKRVSEGVNATDITPMEINWTLTGLSAGTHTIKVRGKNDATSTISVNILERTLHTTLLRGGLVPVQENGVVKTDTPRALNFKGPSVSVGVGTYGEAEVEYLAGSGLEAYDLAGTALPQTISSAYTTGNYTTITGLSQNVTVREGERILASAILNALPAASGTCVARTIIKVGSTIYPLAQHSATQQIDMPMGGAIMTPPLAAGTYTVQVMAGKHASYNNFWIGQTTSQWANMYIHVVRGGYTHPENTPVLVYNSASVVNVASAPGGDSELRLLLTNGNRYTATSPLSVDMTASGLGGLDTGAEASNTWYYVYAVPSATEGIFDVVASVTDPDGGGPTGYSAWRYLGAIRNDASSNIKSFTQVGAEFMFSSPEGTDADIYSVAAGTPSTGAWTNIPLGTAIPTAVASHVFLEGWQDSDAAGVHRMWVNPGNPPGFTPLSASPGGAFLSSQQDAQGTNSKWEQIPGGTISHYWTDVTGNVDLDLRARAWRDKFLVGVPEAHAQRLDSEGLWRYLQPDVLPAGASAPEACWQFDGSGSELNDRTANGHNLTEQGGTRWQVCSDGLVGLRSYDQFRLYETTPNNGIQTLGAYTAEFLVILEKALSVNVLLVADGDDETEATNNCFSLTVRDDGHARAQHEYGAGVESTVDFNACAPIGVLCLVTFTRSADSLTNKFYVDGELLDTGTAGNAATGCTANNYVYLMGGGGAPSRTNYFTGAMFAARFTKQEWSAAQVKQSYQQCRGISA